MHPIDRGAGVAMRFLGDQERVFRDGWGDPDLLAHIDIGTVSPPAPIDLEWGSSHTREGVVVTDGVFRSPVARLPSGARTAHVRRIEPIAGSRRICILLPAWNDEGYRTRSRLAARLAAAGTASLLLEAAFYGARRVDGEGAPMRTVADVAMLSRAVVEEARSLAMRLHTEDTVVGLSGYSMGGSLAGAAAATLDAPLAVTLLAPAHSPRAVMFDGVLAKAVDWEALGPGGKERLEMVLEQGSILRIPPARPTRCAVLVGAKGDGFVQPESTAAIHHHWPGSELWWVNGGHASLLWTRQDLLVRAILRGFERAAASPAG